MSNEQFCQSIQTNNVIHVINIHGSCKISIDQSKTKSEVRLILVYLLEYENPVSSTYMNLLPY